MSGALRETARAKLNLFLHVTGRRPDGYHLLDSLVAFAETGDVLEAEPAPMLSLSIDGPFGDSLGTGSDNLVLSAAETLQREARRIGRDPGGASLRLRKCLPVASGIGGGSADAAAALRLLNRLWSLDLELDALEELAIGLGADVPVCLASTPRMMRGIGERLSPGPALPSAWVLLVNPLRGIGTQAVFRAREGDFSLPVTIPARFGTLDSLCGWLAAETRNDLADAATCLVPEVAQITSVLNVLPEVRLVRMSGSGATCIALFAEKSHARQAQERLLQSHPGWWTETAPLGGA